MCVFRFLRTQPTFFFPIQDLLFKCIRFSVCKYKGLFLSDVKIVSGKERPRSPLSPFSACKRIRKAHALSTAME